MKKTLIGLAIASTMSTGCATIVSDSNYPVAVTSTPAGVSFEIKNEDGKTVHSGVTPATVTLPAENGYFDGETYEVTFGKSEESSHVSTLDSSLDGWYIGNILFGGLIGMIIVDPITGNMWKLPSEHAVELLDISSIDNNNVNTKIVSMNDVPDNLKPHLIPANF